MAEESEDARFGFLLDKETTKKLFRMAAHEEKDPYDLLVRVINRMYMFVFDIPQEDWNNG